MQQFDKEQLKQELLVVESNILGIITNGIVHSTPKRIVLKNIQKEIIHAVQKLGLNRLEANHLYQDALRKYNVISKKTFAELKRIDKKFGKEEDYEKNLERRIESVYKFVRKFVIIPNETTKVANGVANEVEHRVKREEIYGENGFLKQNREEINDYSPFFLCSSHIDPAEDHKDWEGKMYFDEDWKKYVREKPIRKKISAYIHNRKLRSVQWVCGEPVYMITRPNCRHYFTKIGIEEALGDSPKNLVKKHKLYNTVQEEVVEEKVILKRYEKRLFIEKQLLRVAKNDALIDDIKKDTKLVEKWQKICELNKHKRKV